MKSELSFRLKEHGNLCLINLIRNVEVSKILMSFRKLLIMHKCVTSIHTKVNFIFMDIASQEARQLKSPFRIKC